MAKYLLVYKVQEHTLGKLTWGNHSRNQLSNDPKMNLSFYCRLTFYNTDKKRTLRTNTYNGCSLLACGLT
jgi:hypothetical protein